MKHARRKSTPDMTPKHQEKNTRISIKHFRFMLNPFKSEK